jgi:DNA invertase Pin-like site-specific DNA recombinase
MTALRQVLAKLKDQGVSGDRKLVSAILGAVAEVERDRLATVKADQRARNRFLGGTVPYGWRVGDGGELVEVPEQKAVIQQILALRSQGLSLRAIAARLAELGVTVSHMAVQRIVNSDGSRIGCCGVGNRRAGAESVGYPTASS